MPSDTVACMGRIGRSLAPGLLAICVWPTSAPADMPPRDTPVDEVYGQFDEPPQEAEPEGPRARRRDACRQFAEIDDDAVDRARVRLEQTTCTAALWFDGLFGDERHIDAAQRAYGRVETSIENSEFFGTKTRIRFSLRVDFPNLEDRFSLFIGRDAEESIERDRREGFALRSEFPELDDRDQFFAGIGYGLPRRERLSANFRIGVRNLTSPRVFVQSRLLYLAYSDDNEVFQLRLTPFYNSRDGFGVTPGIDYSFVLTPRLLMRWSNIATLSEDTQGLDWRSAAILYQGMGWGRGLAYETFVRGMTDADVPVREYGIRLVYRHPIFRHRLFMQPLIGYSWPKVDPDEDRESAYLVGFGLEMPFGQEF